METAVITEQTVETAVSTEVMAREQELHTLEREAKGLAVIDDATKQAGQIIVSKLKGVVTGLEDEKELITRPLLDELERKRHPYIKAIKFTEAIIKELDQRVGKYIDDKRAEDAARQQRELDAYNKEQAEIAAKAEQARKDAEAAKAAGDVKTAAKLEAKADRAEVKLATMEGPTIVATEAKTQTLVNGDSFTSSGRPAWKINGRDKGAKIHADDAIFVALDWAVMRRFFVLDETRVNAAVKAGEKLPAPFVMFKEYGSTVRGAK